MKCSKIWANGRRSSLKKAIPWTASTSERSKSKQYKFVRSFFGRIYGAPICFPFIWPLGHYLRKYGIYFLFFWIWSLLQKMFKFSFFRSSNCVQKLGYDCKRSRLLNTPIGDSDSFAPYGWWVSRQNRMMDYWAGSLPGMFQKKKKM